MSDVLLRVVWITTIVIAIAYACYLFFGSLVSTNISRAQKQVIANDIISPGEHHISGMIMVPTECDGLSVQVQQTTPFSYQLAFKTWQEPYRDCPSEPASRSFQTVTFAPAVGSTFSATLDGLPFPLTLLEEYKKSGTK